MSQATLVVLHEIFVRGNDIKSSQSNADRARVTIIEGISASD